MTLCPSRNSDQRKPCSPQNSEASQNEQQIIEQETRFARDERCQFVFAGQIRLVGKEESGENDENDYQEPLEPSANRGLREGVNRIQHAAASQVRPEDGEPERGEDQPHVPDLQHAALLLHHDRVQEGGASEPGQQGRVLDRVPSPVSAPAEHVIGPVRAQSNATGEQSPGHHRPAARDVDPFVAWVLHYQGAERKRKGNGESDVAQVEHGRMNHHLLEQGGQSVAVGGQSPMNHGKRPGGEIQQQ